MFVEGMLAESSIKVIFFRLATVAKCILSMFYFDLVGSWLPSWAIWWSERSILHVDGSRSCNLSSLPYREGTIGSLTPVKHSWMIFFLNTLFQSFYWNILNYLYHKILSNLSNSCIAVWSQHWESQGENGGTNKANDQYLLSAQTTSLYFGGTALQEQSN